MSATTVKIKSLLTAADSTGDIIRVSLFALLTVITAQISIPVSPVPFTLQTVAVVLAGALLGAKKGALSQVVYLMLGVLGLPVFAMSADATVGIARLIGPTGGYLLAFPVAAYITGLIIEKHNSSTSQLVSIIAGNVLILLSGVAFLNTFYINDLGQAALFGAGIFSVWSVVKIALTYALYKAVKK